MRKNLEYAICGSMASIFFFVNTYPICERCLIHMRENPHTIEVPFSTGPAGLNYNSGIRITTTVTASTAGIIDLELSIR